MTQFGDGWGASGETHAEKSRRTARGPDNARDEELAALTRLQEMPDFHVYLGVLKRHAMNLRLHLRVVLIDEEDLARHNYRCGQVDGLVLSSRLPELIEQARKEQEPENG